MQLTPEGFQLALLLFQALLALLAGVLVWVWKGHARRVELLAGQVSGLEREFLEFAREVERDKARFASRAELEALEERVRTAVRDALAPIASDVTLIKNAFMEIRRA
jgi:hypothetical protein